MMHHTVRMKKLAVKYTREPINTPAIAARHGGSGTALAFANH